MTKAISSS